MAAVRAGEYGGHHSPMQKARASAGPSAAAAFRARHISPTRQRGASSSNAYGSFWRPTARTARARDVVGAVAGAAPRVPAWCALFAGVGLNHATVVDEVAGATPTAPPAAARRARQPLLQRRARQHVEAARPRDERRVRSTTTRRSTATRGRRRRLRTRPGRGASGIPDDVTTTPMYAGASGTSSKVLGKGGGPGRATRATSRCPTRRRRSEPRPRDAVLVVEIALATGTSTESFGGKPTPTGQRAAGAQEVPHRRRPRHPGVDGRRRRLRPIRRRSRSTTSAGRAPSAAPPRTSNRARLRIQERREAPRRSTVRPPGAASRRATSLGRSTHCPRTGRLHDYDC